MQKSSMPPAFADLRLASDTKLVFHSVADSQRSQLDGGKRYRARQDLRSEEGSRPGRRCGRQHTGQTKRTVSLALDGKVLDSKSVDVPANGRVSVEFLSLDSPHGFHKGEIRIEPGDSLHEDDRFDFAIERTDPHPVLVLASGGTGSR